MSMLDEVLEVLNSQSVRAAREFADKHLVDGALLVTPKQHAELHRWAADQPLEPTRPKPSPLFDIPVVVVQDDGLAHPIGNGKYAVATDSGIYVFPTPDVPFPYRLEVVS